MPRLENGFAVGFVPHKRNGNNPFWKDFEQHKTRCIPDSSLYAVRQVEKIPDNSYGIVIRTLPQFDYCSGAGLWVEILVGRRRGEQERALSFFHPRPKTSGEAVQSKLRSFHSKGTGHPLT